MIFTHPAKNTANSHKSRLTVTLLETGSDYVLLSVAGEKTLKLLPL